MRFEANTKPALGLVNVLAILAMGLQLLPCDFSGVAVAVDDHSGDGN